MGESNIAPKLSICMIVKNEESLIESCINNLKDVADELIVVDTGSTDNTPNILSSIIRNNPALNSKLKVHSFAWVDDFSACKKLLVDKSHRRLDTYN